MTDLKNIETLTREYADEYQELAADVEFLENQIRALKKKALPGIKRAAARAAGAKEKLKAAIDAAPQLFEKPRTRLFHGIKVGITKKKGRVEWDDETKVVERIERLLPKDQAELLIRTEKSVHKRCAPGRAKRWRVVPGSLASRGVESLWRFSAAGRPGPAQQTNRAGSEYARGLGSPVAVYRGPAHPVPASTTSRPRT